MALPKLTKLELQVMEALWTHGASSVREIQEAFPGPRRPAYTTVQTTVYRLEVKKALRRVKRISNANIFEAAISRGAAQGPDRFRSRKAGRVCRPRRHGLDAQALVAGRDGRGDLTKPRT